MAVLHRNISGELTQLLLEHGDSIDIQRISLCNIHADTTCTVDLFIERKLTGRFYLVKGLSLPVGASFIYDNGARFSTNKNQFSLFIKLTKGASETPTVDVIIN